MLCLACYYHISLPVHPQFFVLSYFDDFYRLNGNVRQKEMVVVKKNNIITNTNSGRLYLGDEVLKHCVLTTLGHQNSYHNATLSTFQWHQECASVSLSLSL